MIDKNRQMKRTLLTILLLTGLALAAIFQGTGWATDDNSTKNEQISAPTSGQYPTGHPEPFPNLTAPQTLQQSKDISKTIAAFTAADTMVEEPQIIQLYEELFRLTYATAPDILIARKLRKQKAQESYTAWARRLSPKVDARLSQVREFNTRDENSNSANDDGAIYSYEDGEEYADWEFDLNVPLYRRSLTVQLNIARLEENLAENNLQLQTQELDLRLQELLGNYLESSYRLLNINNSIRLSREHVDKIYRGYELRDQTRLQLLRAQANLKELEARKDLDEHNKEVALRSLLDFTGLKGNEPVFKALNQLLGDEVQVAGCINSLSNVDPKYTVLRSFVESMDREGRRDYFQSNSLLYSKIMLERELAEHKATTFTQNEYPDLAIRGSYDRHEDTQFTKFNGEGSLALVFSIPLFSGGTLFSTQKTQVTAQHIAGITQSADLRERIHSIENNRKLISSLRNVYTTQQINLRQQQEIVVLSVKSYNIKQTSMQDLLTSQNKLIDAKNALMQTTNRLAALYRLFAWELGTPFPSPKTDDTP